jgi:hypothetical protein
MPVSEAAAVQRVEQGLDQLRLGSRATPEESDDVGDNKSGSVVRVRRRAEIQLPHLREAPTQQQPGTPRVQVMKSDARGREEEMATTQPQLRRVVLVKLKTE